MHCGRCLPIESLRLNVALTTWPKDARIAFFRLTRNSPSAGDFIRADVVPENLSPPMNSTAAHTESRCQPFIVVV